MELRRGMVKTLSSSISNIRIYNQLNFHFMNNVINVYAVRPIAEQFRLPQAQTLEFSNAAEVAVNSTKKSNRWKWVLCLTVVGAIMWGRYKVKKQQQESEEFFFNTQNPFNYGQK